MNCLQPLSKSSFYSCMQQFEIQFIRNHIHLILYFFLLSIYSYTQCIYITDRNSNKLHVYKKIINHNMFKNIQIADDFNAVKHDYIPENILRKTIEGLHLKENNFQTKYFYI